MNSVQSALSCDFYFLGKESTGCSSINGGCSIAAQPFHAKAASCSHAWRRTVIWSIPRPWSCWPSHASRSLSTNLVQSSCSNQFATSTVPASREKEKKKKEKNAGHVSRGRTPPFSPSACQRYQCRGRPRWTLQETAEGEIYLILE